MNQLWYLQSGEDDICKVPTSPHSYSVTGGSVADILRPEHGDIEISECSRMF